ncbi:MAG: response regulator [Lachnospiraceae bacterium]|jgi:CheY-like chemotaxis protein|nr:response regulator [Lachnospiraceae bacterium]
MDKNELLMEKVNEELRDALAQTARSDQGKTEYMSQITRSIRIPVNTLNGMTTIARRNINNHDKVLDCLDKIDIAASQLVKLINEITDMSELEESALLMNESTFHLSELMWQTISGHFATASKKSVNICYVVDDVMNEHIIGDSDRLRQILSNLLSNAVAYTMPDGKVTVTVSEVHAFKDDYSLYNITIEDTGIGMTREFMNVMFQPFERVDDPRIAHEQGAGLGLTIAMRLIRMMSGDIKVVSEPGAGSKVTVSMQLRRQEDAVSNAQRDMKVLVVNSDQSEGAEIAEVLQSHGMEVQIITDIEETMEHIVTAEQDIPYNAVIVACEDGNSQSGYQLAQKVKKEYEDCGPLLIFIANKWECDWEWMRTFIDNTYITRPLKDAKILYACDGAGIKTPHSVKPDPVEISLTGKRILVAEDNELTAEMIKEILEQQGIIVEIASNGIKVLDMLQGRGENYYDCVLMDIRMPVMDGYAATRRIRCNARQDIAKLPVIAMTADAFSIDIRKAKYAGMNAHIAKPFNFEEMMKVFSSILS